MNNLKDHVCSYASVGEYIQAVVSFYVSKKLITGDQYVESEPESSNTENWPCRAGWVTQWADSTTHCSFIHCNNISTSHYTSISACLTSSPHVMAVAKLVRAIAF